MSIAICILIAWCVITILLFMPKKMSEPELVFLYFINTIFALSIFTTIHLNLKWIEISKGVDKSFADLVTRLVTVPLYIVISTNVLQYDWKWLKWLTVVAMVVGGGIFQRTLVWLGILMPHHWNMIYAMLMFCCYFTFSWIMAQFIRKVGGKGERAA